PVALQIDGEGDDRLPLDLRTAHDAVDLPLLEQELPVALRRMVLAVAVAVRADVGADQPGLAVADLDEAVLELDPAHPRRLHLGAGEPQPRLERLQDVVVVPRPPVRRQLAHDRPLLLGMTDRLRHGGSISRCPALPRSRHLLDREPSRSYLSGGANHAAACEAS